jgi:3-oxoacyl-[acyl-carrier protein] reductase
MNRLDGKVALISGAARGIGAETARLMVEAGARVVIGDILEERGRETARAIGTDASAVFQRLDVTSEEDWNAAIGAATARWGGLDILVNNAGLTRDTLILRMKDEDWQTVLDVNLTAAFRLSRAATRGMMKRRWGRIVSITSIVGVTGNPGQVNYAASKAGMIGFSKALAQEVASRGITVNTVAPGFIETAMTGALTEEQKSKLLERIPGGRLGTPEDVAAAVAYLASEEAAYVTGQTLHVNGGMAMI